MNNITPIRSPVDEEVVRMIEQLLEFAKRGEIKGFAFVADTIFIGEPPTNYCCCYLSDNWRMLGALEHAKMHVIETIRASRT